MRAGLLILLGCSEHGELPDQCTPDFTLVGSGSSASELVTVRAGEPLSRCLEVDAATPTTLMVSSHSAQHLLSLRSPSGTALVAGRDLVSLDLPAPLTTYVVLEVDVQPPTISSTGTIFVDFAATR